MCGSSEFSSILSQKTLFCPSIPEAPVVKKDGANVKVSWSLPKTSLDAPITKYEIYFLKKSEGNREEYVQLAECNGAYRLAVKFRSCTVPMKDM